MFTRRNKQCLGNAVAFKNTFFQFSWCLISSGVDTNFCGCLNVDLLMPFQIEINQSAHEYGVAIFGTRNFSIISISICFRVSASNLGIFRIIDDYLYLFQARTIAARKTFNAWKALNVCHWERTRRRTEIKPVNAWRVSSKATTCATVC